MRVNVRAILAWLGRPLPILLAALLLRLGAAWLLPLPADFAQRTDSGLTALNVVSGRGYTHDFYGSRPDAPLRAYMPPLHVAWVTLSLLLPNPRLAHSVQQVAAGTLAVWLVYRLAGALGGPLTGGLAGWAMALYPTYIIVTTIPESVVLLSTCLAAVLLLAWRLWEKPGPGRAVAAGLALGLLALGRPQALLLLPALLVWLAVKRPVPARLSRLAALCCLGAGLVVIPWVARNWVVLGGPAFLSTNGGRTCWLGNNPFTTGSGGDVYADKLAAYLGLPRDPSWPEILEFPTGYPFPRGLEARAATLPEQALERAFYRAAVEYVRAEPAEWLALEGRKLLSLWWFRPNLGANPQYQDEWTAAYRLVYAAVAFVALAGLALSLRSDPSPGPIRPVRSSPARGGEDDAWRRWGLIYTVLGIQTLVYLGFHVLTRFRWEMEFILLILASFLIARACQRAGLTSVGPADRLAPLGGAR